MDLWIYLNQKWIDVASCHLPCPTRNKFPWLKIARCHIYSLELLGRQTRPFRRKKMGQLGSRFGWFFKDGREETNCSTKKLRFPFGAQKRCSWGGGEFLHKMQLTFKHGKVIHLEETAGMIFAGAVFWIQRLDLQMNTKYIQYIYT